MLWSVNKYDLDLSGGEFKKKLDPMFGVIQQLSIVPFKRDTIWSMQLIDKDNDIIYEKIDHEGRLDERQSIPIGNQSGEELILKVYDSTSNEKFRAILKIREIV